MHMHGGRLSAFPSIHLQWRSAHHPMHQFHSWKACSSLPSLVNINSLRPRWAVMSREDSSFGLQNPADTTLEDGRLTREESHGVMRVHFYGQLRPLCNH